MASIKTTPAFDIEKALSTLPINTRILNRDTLLVDKTFYIKRFGSVDQMACEDEIRKGIINALWKVAPTKHLESAINMVNRIKIRFI